MLFADPLDPKRLHQFTEQPRRTEPRMIHEVTELFRMRRFICEHIQQIFLRKTIGFAQFCGNICCQDLICGRKRPAIQVFKMLFSFFADLSQHVHGPVCDHHAVFAAFLIVYFEISHDLFERQLKRIADIMEQRGKSPEFQKGVCGFCVFFFILFVGIKLIELFKCFPVMLVGLIKRQPQRKDIYRVGIMIPVFHQKGTAVGFEFRKQFDHFFGFAIMAKKHFQIAVVYIVRIFCHAGIDESLQFPLQTEPVQIHLHIIRDLIRRNAGSGKFVWIHLVFFRIK